MEEHEEKLLKDAIKTAIKTEIKYNKLKRFLIVQDILFFLIVAGEILWINLF